MNRKEFEKDLSTYKKDLLGPLFKICTVDGNSLEDPRNLPKALGVITCVRDMVEFLNVWNHLFETKDMFPKIRISELDLPELKKLAKGRVPVLLHPSLYKVVNRMHPMDVDGIVLVGRMTSELGTRSPELSVGVLVIRGRLEIPHLESHKLASTEDSILVWRVKAASLFLLSLLPSRRLGAFVSPGKNRVSPLSVDQP